MTKALGKDIWDFYLNGYPTEYAHDDWDIQVAHWPSTADDSTGAYSLLDDEKEYDLGNFGTFYHDKTELSFEDAYLAWKGIEKPDMFEEWFATSNYSHYVDHNKEILKEVWNAAIASIKSESQSQETRSRHSCKPMIP